MIPNQKQNGFDNHAEAEPVIAKTINMIVSWKFVSIPQRCFSLFIFIYNDYKYSNIIEWGLSQKVFVDSYFENKPCSCRSNNLLRSRNQYLNCN